MKRTWLWLSGIVCVLLVLGACASQIVYDENLPLEESAHLMFWGGAEVTAYNGIPVPYKKILDGTMSKWRTVYLPPGEMEFTLNACVEHYTWDNFNRLVKVRYFADNVLFRYKFEAGKHYIIVSSDTGGPDDTKEEWGVRIYDSPTAKPQNPKKENFIAFVPFYRLEN